jgi:probable HAF family extracellular repeat protein
MLAIRQGLRDHLAVVRHRLTASVVIAVLAGCGNAGRSAPESPRYELIGSSDTTIESSATAISGDGKVVVGSIESAPGDPTPSPQAFRWSEAEGLVNLNTPGAAMVVSYDGSVIAGINFYRRLGSVSPFLWSRGLVQQLTLPDTTTPYAAIGAMSHDGSVVLGEGVQRWGDSRLSLDPPLGERDTVSSPCRR